MQERISLVVLPVLILIPGLIAWRNVRSRRGDLRSAFRFGLFAFTLSLLEETLTRTHYTGIGLETGVFLEGLKVCLFRGILLGIGYVAAEPYLRRHWPDLLISWTRLVTGRIRDALVGRDILVGASAGALLVALWEASMLLPARFGHPMRAPWEVGLETLMGGRLALGQLFEGSFVENAMEGVLFFVLFLFVLRKKFLAITAAFVVMDIAMTGADLARLSDPAQLTDYAVDTLTVAFAFVVALRFGLLALLAFLFFYLRLMEFPITFDTSSWYASTSTLLLVALGAIALYAYRIATAGRSAGVVQDVRMVA